MYLVLGHQPSFGYDGSPTGLWYDQPPRIVMATEAISLLLTGRNQCYAQWETTLRDGYDGECALSVDALKSFESLFHGSAPFASVDALTVRVEANAELECFH